jgi:hypothetical protein
MMATRIVKTLPVSKNNGENIMQEIIIGRTYRHFKGNLYKVVGFAKHSETLEDMIIYSPLKTGDTWVRPKTMWNEVVDDQGTLRFTLLEE